MICGKCEQILDRQTAAPTFSKLRQASTSARLGLLLCERCGAVLPATAADDHLLRRVAQLSRFGIGGESGPILTQASVRD